MALAIMRPPVVVPTSERRRYTVIGNLATFAWCRHIAVLRDDADPPIWVILLADGAADPKIFHAAENLLAPLVLDQLTHKAGREAKRALRQAKSEAALLERAPANRRLKPLFRR
jgi:hypothetical protein